jgi:hypothetical protein
MVTNISVLVTLGWRDFYCHWNETETSFNNEIKGDNHIAIAWHKTERNVNPAALAFRRAIFFIAGAATIQRGHPSCRGHRLFLRQLLSAAQRLSATFIWIGRKAFPPGRRRGRRHIPLSGESPRNTPFRLRVRTEVAPTGAAAVKVALMMTVRQDYLDQRFRNSNHIKQPCRA